MDDNMKQKCAKLYDYLKKFSIYDLRNIARELGVHSPTTKKVSELADSIVEISISGKGREPSKNKGKGARPKSSANSVWLGEITKLSIEILDSVPYTEGNTDFRIQAHDSGEKTPGADYANSVVTGYVDTDSAGENVLLRYRNGSYNADAAIPGSVVKSYQLRNGDKIGCFIRVTDGSAEVWKITNINSFSPDKCFERNNFEELTPCYATDRFSFGANDRDLRAIDVLNPLGKGQRALIAAPAGSGKIALLNRMIRSLSENGDNTDVVALLIAARPEDVTEFRKLTPRIDVFSTTFDMPDKMHVQIASLAFEHAQRLVESGRDAVVFVDGMTDLAIACSERFRSFDNAVYEKTAIGPEGKKFFALARKCEEGGSLTIVAVVRAQEDDVKEQRIYRELRNVANREYRLDASLHEKRIFPPVDFCNSFAFGEDYLFDEKEYACVSRIKEKLAGENDPSSFYRILLTEPDGDDLPVRLSDKF